MRVLITGANRGIGRALIDVFLNQGHRIWGLSRNTSELSQLTGIESVAIDIGDENQVKQWVASVGTQRFDVLINNAANDERHSPEEVTPEYWENRLKVNLNHQFFAAQAVQPKMAKAGGGSIINMGSISWHLALEFMPAYTSSKAAIEGLTVGLARSYGKDRIRVNCIIPGSVRTPRQVKEILTPEYEKFITGQQCLPDQILPEDIAQLALFLGSDAGRMCTRRSYFMDAGLGA